MYWGPIKQLTKVCVALDSPRSSILFSHQGLLSKDEMDLQVSHSKNSKNFVSPSRAAAGNILLFSFFLLPTNGWVDNTTGEVLPEITGALKTIFAWLMLQWNIFTKDYFQAPLAVTCQQESLRALPSSYLYRGFSWWFWEWLPHFTLRGNTDSDPKLAATQASLASPPKLWSQLLRRCLEFKKEKFC